MDETACGPLCQHPSCWDSHRRCSRGQHHRTQDLPTEEIEDDDDDDGCLPTQKVVNLLGDYGDDPRDLYPARYNGRPTHERTSTSLHVGRSRTRESFPKVTAPNATPASLRRSSVANGGIRSAPAKSTSNQMRFVEVQEVFDLDDLQSAWNDTFMTKSYYMWMPGARGRHHHQLGPLHSNTKKRVTCHPQSVLLKDKTEEMISEKFELERESTQVGLSEGDEPNNAKHKRRKNVPSPRSRANQVNPNTHLYDAKKDKYYGIYELLDLPREVLVGVLEHIKESDLLNRQKFADALVKAIPKLEQQSKSLALANSQVLKQRKMKLLAGNSRNGNLPSNTKQVFMLDGETLDKVSSANNPLFLKEPEKHPKETIQAEASTLPGAKKLLPSIVQDGTRFKVPSISLGLPELPTGIRHTQPFNYKHANLDFTLGRVPTPPEVENTESPGSTERSSTMHVTMPSMPSEESLSCTKDWQRTHATPNTPLHAVSPAHSTQVPYAPAATPAMRQGEGPSTPLSAGPSPAKHVASDHVSPTKTSGVVPRADIKGTPEQAVALGTIVESDTVTQRKASQGRLVRFAEAPPTPPQPPQPPPTPKELAKPSLAYTNQPANRCTKDMQAESGIDIINENDMEGLITINKMSGSRQSSRTLSKGNHSHSKVDGAAASPGLSPEPSWPEVDEANYMRSPSPNRQSGGLSGADNMEVSSMTLINKSHRTGSRESSMPKAVVAHVQPVGGDKPPQSHLIRDSPAHSDMNKVAMAERIMESPGPPPPSPEPKDPMPKDGSTSDDVLLHHSCDVSGTTQAVAPSTTTRDLFEVPNQPVNTPRTNTSCNSPSPSEETPRVSGAPSQMDGDTTNPNAPVEVPTQVDTEGNDTDSAPGVVSDGIINNKSTEDSQSAVVETHVYEPGQPSGIISVGPVAPMGNDPVTDTAVQLDEFGATQADFKQELMKEYDKLSDTK